MAKSLSFDINPAIAEIAIFRLFYNICVQLQFLNQIELISIFAVLYAFSNDYTLYDGRWEGQNETNC